MESVIHFFIYQWQRKLLAFLIALVIWFFVNHSITSTKTIPNVPIRIINLPADKTIQGLLPNGIFNKRIQLTVTGTKDIVDQLEPGDLEVIVDVSTLNNEGLVQITKKNLVSLNPNINLLRHITNVMHPELVIKTSLLLTEKIPVTIYPPTGTPPEGYEFLDIWPTKLTQTVTGPQDIVLKLKSRGLEITFNLNEISKEDLDSIKPSLDDSYDDEVSYIVPEQWKRVVVPLTVSIAEPLNDPEAKNLHINFLRREYIPIKGDTIPLNIFYPLKYSNTLNPKTRSLATNSHIQFENHIPVLKIPLFAYRVSKLFVDIVKSNLLLNIVAAPRSERETLEWSVDFVNYPHLEDTYVAFLLSTTKFHIGTRSLEFEEHFRHRFRAYMFNFSLFLASHQPLELDSAIEDHQINIHVTHTADSTHAR